MSMQPLAWLRAAGLVVARAGTPRMLAAFGLFGAAVPAWTSSASAQDLGAIGRELVDLEGATSALSEMTLQQSALRSPTFVEERLTDGELFYRLQDYIRASIIFTDIVENHSTHAAFPDALYLLGDSLFRAGDYLGARSRFREILERSGERAFQAYVQRALGRLIEIAIRTRNFDGIEDVFSRLNRLPPTEIEAATAYYRAKYLYSRAVPVDDVLRSSIGSTDTGRPSTSAVDLAVLEQARQAFESVPEGSPYYPQARYFVGVTFTLREQYPQAIEAFTRVLRARATTEEHRTVAELTQLALGRLYYETDQLEQSVEAYQAVPRTSANFDEALYEVAWVYIRMGDSVRAERALEVLSVASPDSRHIPDGKLLRANLLFRNGRFAEANRVFEEVEREFGPVRQELDDMLTERTSDPAAYFRSLVRENLDAFDVNAFLPPLAQRWAHLEGDIDRALSVLSDLSDARRLVQETGELVQRLTAALEQPNRVAIFWDLRRDRERTTALRNRLVRVRQQLAGLEARESGAMSPELERVRAQRRELERYLSQMPTSEDGFESMDGLVTGRYERLQRELARLEVELLGMEARIAATDRYLEQTAGSRDAGAEEGVRNELRQQRQAVADYRAQIAEFRVMIEAGRLQVGVGDDRYARQARVRSEYSRLVDEERRLGGGGGRYDSYFSRIGAVETALEARDRAVDRVVEERTVAIRRQVDEESARVEGYRRELASLESETEEVVGAVTYGNYRRVQRRFYDLVLRADVGTIDVSWAEREEHRMRVEMLTRERSQELRNLDDEFRGITDEGASPSSGDAPGGTAEGSSP